MRYVGYDVTYVRNVTDIDDKLLKKAEQSGDIMKYIDIAREFTELFQQEMGELNCVVPDAEPRVTDHIPQIISFIQALIKKNKAYAVDGDVYFDISSYKPYGELSGKNLDDLIAGARVDVNTKKKSPADFVLWKKADGFWDSPWGEGRPGWHIECSVLAKEFLGEAIDIHCGGMDLIFPHHENERAQSEALHGKIFSKFWVHNALLNIDKQKMSKSIGNILSLKEIFEKYDPMVLRYYFLQHQYRTPIEFSFAMLDAAKVAYKKLLGAFGEVEAKRDDAVPVVKKMIEALADDLNTPKMLGILFENLYEIRKDEKALSAVKYFLVEVCGLAFAPLPEQKVEMTPAIIDLIAKREAARKEKRWEEADSIRKDLKKLGYEVFDKKL